MSRSGMIAAREHGAHLPKFGSLREAEVSLFRDRDQLLVELTEFAQESSAFECTFQPESLKALELWYFRLLEDDAFSTRSMPRFKFERCIAAYFGETLVHSAGFEWFVSEYVFSPGRYEIGIRRGLGSIMLTRPRSPDPLERNKRKQSLWREYRRYAG